MIFSISAAVEPADGVRVVFNAPEPFDPLSVQIFVNGIAMDPSKFSESGGTSVTLTDPPLTGSEVDVGYLK